MGKQAVDSLHHDAMGASVLRSYAKEQKTKRSNVFKKFAYCGGNNDPDIVGVVIPYFHYQILFKILPLLLAGNSVVINPPIQSPHGS